MSTGASQVTGSGKPLHNEDPERRPWYRVVFGYVDRREIPWAGFAWVSIVAILYSTLILWLASEEFWDWLSTFMATILSVLAAIFLYRHQGNRAELEKLYRLYMVLDADLEALLTRIDPSRNDIGPLSITLPTGRVASAYISMGEERMPIFEEVARLGSQKRSDALLDFMMASAVRAYGAASSHYADLFRAACTAPSVGPNTEEALLHAAHIVERNRKSLIQNCERHRDALGRWFKEYSHLSPWGPEHEDPPPTWQDFLKPETNQVEGHNADPQVAGRTMSKTHDYVHAYTNEGVSGSCRVRVYEGGKRPVVVATQQRAPQGAHRGSVLNAANIIAADLIRHGVLSEFQVSHEVRTDAVRRQSAKPIADVAPFVFVEEYLEPEHHLAFLWFDSYEILSLVLGGEVQQQIGNPFRQDTSRGEVEALIGSSLDD
jgi:hypothetical protein